MGLAVIVIVRQFVQQLALVRRRPPRFTVNTSPGTCHLRLRWPPHTIGSRTYWPPNCLAGGVITVAIVEDNRLVREGMTEMLNDLADVKVVLAATSLDADQLRALTPDVVLLDVGLRDTQSLRLAESMKADLPGTAVIVMDLLPVHEEIAQFVNAGVAGFILKDATFEDFVATIRSVASGVRVLPPRMTGTLFSQIAQAAVKRGAEEAIEAVRMTPREREVIGLIAKGHSNKEIATALTMATHTVKSHVRNIMEKLALHSRLQIAAYAHQQDD